MTVVPMRTMIRPEAEHLFKAEELSRAARRLLIPSNPAGEVEAFGATTLIDEAIAQLVAARKAIAGEAGEDGERQA